MGSLIAALNNQNISAANAETLGDVYSANPANSGYTDNPFGYAASPAVIQTAYNKYGYNATAPQTPESYEDYDLTSLFGMLEKMKGATGAAGAQGTAGAAGAAGTSLTQGQLDALNALMKKPQDDRLTPADPLGVGTEGRLRAIDGRQIVDRPSLYDLPPLQPGHPLYDPGPYNPNQPVTPGGILAEAGKVQPGVQPVQPGLPPVKGAYTVPGAPTAPADTTAEDQAAAQATEDARIQKMFAEQIAANELANAQRIYNTTRRDTAGPQTTFTSAAAARAGTQKIKEDWANLIDSGGM